jgi:RNA-directed DNA polymerase
MGPRQLSFAFADSPFGGGKNELSDASERRNFLLQKAKSKKTSGPSAGAADTSRLLEEAASEANLARALLNVVRNKGAPGVDSQTVEAAEAKAPAIIARVRRDLLEGCYRPGDVRRVWLPKPWSRSSSQPFIPVVTGSAPNVALIPPSPKQRDI